MRLLLVGESNESIEYLRCVQFFFACEKQFENWRGYYLRNYGLIPCFKAGLHMGKVTAVEIGEIKGILLIMTIH